MKFILVMVVIVLFTNLVVECSEIHVKEEESWYEDQANPPTPPKQSTNLGTDSNNHHYQKLLSVERQITISEQMIKLYQERLAVLKNLKEQLKVLLAKQKIQLQTSQYTITDQSLDAETGFDSNSKQNGQFSPRNQHYQNRKKSSSNAYVFLNKFNFQVQVQQANNQINEALVLVPPFVINKAKSQISILGSQQQKNAGKITKYQYGQTSNRLLFYWLEKSFQDVKQNGDQDQSEKSTLFSLNIALEIKPNKIKSVKINYHQKQSFNQSIFTDSFQIQQAVTSYESHQLISENFKWHKALQFENQIIGFVNQKIYIKGKDKKMNEVEIGSKVLAIYSLNQYKLLYIAEDKVGTINVRSFTKSDDIRYEHYLGNRTLIRQRQLQRKKDKQGGQLDDEDHSHESFDPGHYWDSPFTKNFSALRAISVYHLEFSKQILILLSNGELLLHSNEKFIASTNMGTPLMKILKFQNFFNSQQSKASQKIQIKIELLPSFRHILISSNFYNKILIFNVTVPYLTQISKASGMSFFPSSSKSNELTVKYWQTLQISGQRQNQQTQRKKPQNIQIYTFITSPLSRQVISQVAKRLSDLDERAIYLYHCRYSSLEADSQINNQKIDVKNQKLTQIKISQYRLLLNLFDQGSFSSSISPVAQGRSFWWNILLVAMIVIGVLVIRKCKSGSSQPQQQWDKPVSRPNRPKSSANTSQSGKNFPKMTKQQERPPTTQTKIEYDNMVISELQSYLEKQGQKLTKQQIALMIRQTQLNEQNQQKKKMQMKRQQKSQQSDPEEASLLKKPNHKNNDEKQKKKSIGQQKQKPEKPDQNLKKKKQ